MNRFVWAYPKHHNLMIISEPDMGKALIPVLDEIALAADGYMLPDDKGGPIMVEIGETENGKWSSLIYAEDQRPVRVLRINLDRSVQLLNARQTEFETSMLKFLAAIFEAFAVGDVGIEESYEWSLNFARGAR
jgi:hypothetical protein